MSFVGIPIAYPRMNFMEAVLGSSLNPLVAMAKKGSSKLGSFVNKFNAEAELLDDLVKHSRSPGQVFLLMSSYLERSLDC